MTATIHERTPIGLTARAQRLLLVSVITVLCAAVAWWPGLPGSGATAHHESVLGSVVVQWPSHGQAAIEVVGAGHRVSGPPSPAPIASVAKVMTAYVVLREWPLTAGQDGFSLTFTQTDADAAAAAKASGQSYVPVSAGLTMTERQALEALLLPSANNIAHALAARFPGGESAFIAAMNQRARILHMRHTIYTDPSGLSATTTSTARDQLRLARAAMRVPAFAAIVAMPYAYLPGIGRVDNTDSLLGRDGVVGIKTGSTDAAGGCFMFQAQQVRGGKPRVLVGVVLGQRDGPLIRAALSSARRLIRTTMGQLGVAEATAGPRNQSDSRVVDPRGAPAGRVVAYGPFERFRPYEGSARGGTAKRSAGSGGRALHAVARRPARDLHAGRPHRPPDDLRRRGAVVPAPDGQPARRW
jgi:D-alanyl-D-alanine carboxypeptidase (penicillin-binding protein 5/6)